MKIEPGKYYKTRDGHKARIYATDGYSGFPVHGAILIDSVWEPALWDLNGINHTNLAISHDKSLISEWIDEPVVSWLAMPAWCNYVAMDKCGDWNWYITKPEIDNYLDIWMPTGIPYNKIPKQYAPTFTGDWKDSLAERKP